ncbi:Pertactin autotransporter [Saezia sanguinis]|uniref:Pertactin autotransporter n=1 Tax=Saezia sanguinis TaxID=1965230 RepID=A0A433SHS5_9BURK|nr:autotransporter outer membrane beta-barrel domain-containing protein [Saezia sanguinis]RUS68291.1 Pertactin autotransporter [Saezia sanguinis]
MKTKHPFKKSQMACAISVLGLSMTAFSAYAAPCTVDVNSRIVLSDGSACTSDSASNLRQIQITNGTVDQSGQNTDLTITANTSDIDATGSRFTGISAVGASSHYVFGSVANGNNNLTITGTQAGTTYGEAQGIVSRTSSSVKIYANQLNITTTSTNTAAGRTFGMYAYSGGNIEIEANEVNINQMGQNINIGIEAANNSQVVIRGKSGNLSMTNITINGNSNSYALSAGANSLLQLDLINIQSTGSGSSAYGIGIHARGAGALLEFKGGDISSSGSHAGTGIRTFELGTVDVKGYSTALGGGHFNIYTGSMDARGIRATGGSTVKVNTDQYADFVTTIHTTGAISDGLNAGRLRHGGEPGAQYSSSNITTYGETHIQTDGTSSYGIRLMGDGAAIQMLSVPGQQGRSTLHSASTAVRFNFGNGYSTNQDGSTAIRPQTAILESVDITTDGQTGSFALGNNRNSTLCQLVGGLCDLNGNNTWTTGHLIQVGDHQGDVGVQGSGSYAITVADAVKDGVLTLRDSTATAADGKDLLNVTYGGGTALVTDKVSSSFTLNAEQGSILRGSIFTDTTPDDITGESSSTTLNLSGNSEWYVTRDSNVTNLNLSNGHVYLNEHAQWRGAGGSPMPGQPTGYTTLTVNHLNGSNGTLYFHSDISNGVTDKLVVTETNATSGTHYVYVKNDGSQVTTGTETLAIIETQGGSAQFLSGQVQADGSAATRKAELGGYLYDVRQQAGTQNWELYAVPADPLLPADPRNPGAAITQPATAAANFMNVSYLMGYIDMQTLLQRMGQLRQGVNTDKDVWIRTFGGQLDGFGGGKLTNFDMDYYGIQGGTDTQLDVDNGRVYIGVMGGYSQGKPNYTFGSGKAHAYHVGVYGTYINDDDYYIDGVLRYTRMKNEFDVVDTQMSMIHGSASTNGFSFSVEGGKRFYLQDNSSKQGFYLEPQLQYIYSHQGSDTVHSTNGLRVGLGSYDSNMLRASVLAGYAIRENDNPVDAYIKVGYLHEFSGNTSYTLNYSKESHDFGQSMLDLGIGINAQFNKAHNLFAELGYTNGSRFDSKQINVGYRFAF